jgi:hypothetical protein
MELAGKENLILGYDITFDSGHNLLFFLLLDLLVSCVNILDGALVTEANLRNFVAVTAEDLLEGANGVLQLYVYTILAGELLCNMERLT